MTRRQLVLTAIAGLVAPGPATAAPTATDQLRDAIDRVLKIVQDPELRKPARAEARRRQLRAVANEIFDWSETARRALGRHWQGRSGGERQEFTGLFADLVERSYVGKIEGFSGERVVYAGEALEGDQATVRTRLVTRANTEISVDYRLLKEGDRWRAYDVLIEGVGLVANYRGQFNRVITQSGYDELVRRMRAKQDELTFGDGGDGGAAPSPAPRKP